MLEQTIVADPAFPAQLLLRKFEEGLPYEAYVATGKPDQQQAWEQVYAQAALTDEQRTLVQGFVRQMKLIVLSGMWCGDCVAQCPLLARIAQANPDMVQLRLLDRDSHMDLAQRARINGGLRVPTVLFTAEDGEFVGLYGDRVLSRYRAVAARNLGAACPLPGAPIPEDETRAALQEWLDEIERVQLLLRLSPRLREKHGD